MNARIWTSTGILMAFGAVVASAAPRPAAPAHKARRALAAAAPQPGTRAMAPQEARMAIAMLDDAYHLILEETHATYHTQPNLPVAANVVRKVQERMAELGWPRARFLAVNAIVMHPDHLPRDDFERRAVQKLRGSDRRVEQVVDGQLRVATTVSTGGSCFGCHWTPPGQESRAAITFAVPLQQERGRGR